MGDITFIKGEKGGRFPDANSIFIPGDIPTVIDPATRPDELERIELQYGVRLVINTHYHIDHIRYNNIFTSAQIIAHRADAAAISSLDEAARIIGVAGQPWEDAWRFGITEIYGYKETPVSRKLTGGEEINIGENTIRFIHTPGHTPGHMCLQFVEKRAVYLADIDLTPFGPWYGNLHSDIDDFLGSIELLKDIDADTWYTSHEEGVIRGDISKRLDEYAKVINERDELILGFLSEAKTLPQIVDKTFIYGKRWEPAEMFDFFEGMMVKKHLDRLERTGLVAFEDGRWSLRP